MRRFVVLCVAARAGVPVICAVLRPLGFPVVVQGFDNILVCRIDIAAAYAFIGAVAVGGAGRLDCLVQDGVLVSERGFISRAERVAARAAADLLTGFGAGGGHGGIVHPLGEVVPAGRRDGCAFVLLGMADGAFLVLNAVYAAGLVRIDDPFPAVIAGRRDGRAFVLLRVADGALLVLDAVGAAGGLCVGHPCKGMTGRGAGNGDFVRRFGVVRAIELDGRGVLHDAVVRAVLRGNDGRVDLVIGHGLFVAAAGAGEGRRRAAVIARPVPDGFAVGVDVRRRVQQIQIQHHRGTNAGSCGIGIDAGIYPAIVVDRAYTAGILACRAQIPTGTSVPRRYGYALTFCIIRTCRLPDRIIRPVFSAETIRRSQYVIPREQKYLIRCRNAVVVGIIRSASAVVQRRRGNSFFILRREGRTQKIVVQPLAQGAFGVIVRIVRLVRIAPVRIIVRLDVNGIIVVRLAVDERLTQHKAGCRVEHAPLQRLVAEPIRHAGSVTVVMLSASPFAGLISRIIRTIR